MLATYYTAPTGSRKPQQLASQGRHAVHIDFVGKLPGTARLPGPDEPLDGRETKAFAKAHHRKLQGSEATVFLRARPTDSLRVIPATEL